MKILVFSDTHLTDVFDERKFNFLKKIIQDADQVIINGDFWDGFLTSFEKFVSSPWKGLFPLLKEKNTVYVYGNHDRATLADKRVNLFSVSQAQEYTFASKNTVYLFEHGHESFAFCDGKIVLPHFVLRTVTRCSTYAEFIFTKLWGRSTRFFGHRLNRRLKRKAQSRNGHTSVFGHTHYAEHDKENNFLNTGYIQHGLAQYLLIDGDRVLAKEEKYS